jgi:hypothetical protein
LSNEERRALHEANIDRQMRMEVLVRKREAASAAIDQLSSGRCACVIAVRQGFEFCERPSLTS